MAIHDQKLSVITVVQDADSEARAPWGDRVVLLDLATGVAHSSKHVVVALNTSDGVVDHTHPNASLRLRDERVGKLPAHLVRSEPIHLEEDLALCLGDRLEHRGEGLLAIVEQCHAIARDQGLEPGGGAQNTAQLLKCVSWRAWPHYLGAPMLSSPSVAYHIETDATHAKWGDN